MSKQPSKKWDALLTKEFLEKCIQEGKTFTEIGKIVGLSYSCTGPIEYRLKKFGLIFPKSKWLQDREAKQLERDNQQLRLKNPYNYVECVICGIKKEHLAYHINHIHNLSTIQYRELFPKAEICSKLFVEKTSKARIKCMLETPEKQPDRVKHYKQGWFDFTNLDKQIHYRSSWEEKGLKFINSKFFEVSEFLSESFSIPYLDLQGTLRRTVPDWLISLKNGNRYLVEVKPFMKLNEAETVVKLQCAEDWAKSNGVTYCIWTWNVISKLSSTTMSLEEILKATVAHQNGERYSLNSLVTS